MLVTILIFVIEGVEKYFDAEIVKIIIKPLVTIALNMACLTIWQGDVATHHQAIREIERDCWYWATNNRRGFIQKVL